MYRSMLSRNGSQRICDVQSSAHVGRNREISSKISLETSRNSYAGSIKALQSWHNVRNEPSVIRLFDDFRRNFDHKLTLTRYVKMRDFLITYLLLSNGQRPGVIVGMLLSEVDTAAHDIVEGYHQLIVSKHKIGYLQSAVLFVYPYIYKQLYFFSCSVLKRLPNGRIITKHSRFFLEFNGKTLNSSKISVIVRHYLNSVGIQFDGTATDLRKASATLSAKFRPDKQDVVSDFLCHSRIVHDKFYRVQHGEDRFVEAFEILQRVHENPCERDETSVIVAEFQTHYGLADESEDHLSFQNDSSLGNVPSISCTRLRNISELSKDVVQTDLSHVEVAESILHHDSSFPGALLLRSDSLDSFSNISCTRSHSIDEFLILLWRIIWFIRMFLNIVLIMSLPIMP